jgi:hypothetical protein
MLALLAMTFSDEVALLDTTANPRETSREIGETNLLRAQHHRTSKVKWVTSKVSNNNFSLVIAIAAQSINLSAPLATSNMEVSLN